MNTKINKYRYPFDEAEDWAIFDIRKNRKMDRIQADIDMLVNFDQPEVIVAKKRWKYSRTNPL